MEREDLLLVAGEASGDLHGAALLRELEKLGERPRVFGLGGELLRGRGMETVADFRTLSVVGLWEVLWTVPRARRIFKHLLDEVDRRRPSVAVLIDFPEFNLRLARELKKRGVRVVYYVSPQVWAWRRGRLKTISRVVDKMLVLFQFETELYRQSGVDVVHVGHPLVDEVPRLEQAWNMVAPGELPKEYTIAILPGSRRSEVDRLLPPLLATAQRLAAELPCRFLVVRASSVPEERLQATIEGSRLDIRVESKDRFTAVAASHLALCASGTATLEVGLLGTPMIVVYRVGGASSILGRFVIRVPHISLVNLVLQEGLVTELLQRDMAPGRIASEARDLLTDRRRIDLMREGLGRLWLLLGESGASRRGAEQLAEVLSDASADRTR